MDFVGEAAEAAGDPQGGHGSTFNDGIALFMNLDVDENSSQSGDSGLGDDL